MTERLFHLRTITPGPGLANALEQLARGDGFVFDDIWFRSDGTDLMIEALVYAQVSRVSETCAAGLLRRARAAFERLKAENQFAATVANLTPRFAVIRDHGVGTAVLCRLDGNELVWTHPF